MNVTIQDWSGFIGQWDDRQWKQRKCGSSHARRRLTFHRTSRRCLQRSRTRRDPYGEMLGITPGFIKRAPLGVVRLASPHPGGHE